MDGALVEVMDGALVGVMDVALVEVMDGPLVGVKDGAGVGEFVGVFIEGVVVGAVLRAAERVLVGAAVGKVVLVVVGEAVLRVVVGTVIVGDTLGAMVELLEGVFVLTILPALIADVRKVSKLIEPNPVDGSHPTAGKKPSLQHLLYILPLDLIFNWLQLFLVPPVISLVNCA
jgi:hypothetical protein